MSVADSWKRKKLAGMEPLSLLQRWSETACCPPQIYPTKLPISAGFRYH